MKEIKIKISDREYNLRVDPKDEELLKTAARSINEKIKQQKEKFNLNNNQDLLAMIAFNSVVENIKMQNHAEKIDDRLDAINRQISEALH